MIRRKFFSLAAAAALSFSAAASAQGARSLIVPGGDLTGTGTPPTITTDAVTSTALAPNAVTHAKLAQKPATTIKCNTTLTGAAPGDCGGLQASIVQNSLMAVNFAVIQNVAGLSGTQTLVVLAGNPVTGDTLLLTAQTTTSQNGPWVYNTSGAWTRPSDFPTGEVIPTLCAIVVVDASTGAQFALGTGSPITVDTTAQTWTLLASTYASTIEGPPNYASSSGGTGLTILGPSNFFTGTGAGNAGPLNIIGGGASQTNTGAGKGAPVNIRGGVNGGSTGTSAAGSVTLSGGLTINSGPAGQLLLADATQTAGSWTPITWAQIGVTNGFQLPAKAANGGITCNAGNVGSEMSVSDAMAPTNGAAYTSGGAVNALIWCNGTAWIVAVH